MQEKENFSVGDSLAVIQQMINAAKQEQKDNGIGWIVWGWLLFAVSIMSFINQTEQWFSQYFFWNLFGAASIIILVYSVVQVLFIKPRQKVKTYASELFKHLNIGFFITLLLIIFSINMGVPPSKGFALLLGLYGFWILIYAAATNFKPSMCGAYFTWIMAFASLFVSDFKWTMLLHAIAIMGGYIIPGHLANRAFRKLNQKTIG